MPHAVFTALIDFDDDLDWAAPHDDVSARLRAAEGLVIERGKDQIRRIAPPMIAKASFVLDNRDGELSYANAGSSLAGKLDPFHRARLTATYIDDGEILTTEGGDPLTEEGGDELGDAWGGPYNLFTGYTTDLTQRPVYNAAQVGVPCLGPLVWLRGSGVRISTPLYYNIRTDAALHAILEAAGYPYGGDYRIFDVGKTTLAFWWAADADAYDAMLQVLGSEGPGATIYEDGDGAIRFESRHYRLLTARCTASQATFGPDAEPRMAIDGWTYDAKLQDVINDAALTVNERAAEALAAIWTGPTPLTLGASESRAFVIDAGGDPFDAAVCTAVGGDYTVSAGSVSSATLDRTSGGNATLTLTAGAGGVTVTGLRVRAVKYAKTTVTVRPRVDTSASRARYGVRSLTPTIWPELTANDAQDLVDGLVALYQSPRPTVRFAVNNGTNLRLREIISRQISDRITVEEDQTSLAADFFIESLRHEVGMGGRVQRLIVGAEQVTDLGGLVLDSATLGILDTNTLGF